MDVCPKKGLASIQAAAGVHLSQDPLSSSIRPQHWGWLHPPEAERSLWIDPEARLEEPEAVQMPGNLLISRQGTGQPRPHLPWRSSLRSREAKQTCLGWIFGIIIYQTFSEPQFPHL